MLYHNDKAHAVYIDGKLIPPGESRDVNPSLVPLDQREENKAQPAGIPGQLGVVAGVTVQTGEPAPDPALEAARAAAEAAAQAGTTNTSQSAPPIAGDPGESGAISETAPDAPAADAAAATTTTTKKR